MEYIDLTDRDPEPKVTLSMEWYRDSDLINQVLKSGDLCSAMWNFQQRLNSYTNGASLTMSADELAEKIRDEWFLELEAHSIDIDTLCR